MTCLILKKKVGPLFNWIIKCWQILFDMGSGILALITGRCWKAVVPMFVHATLAAILLPESSSGVFYLITLYFIASSWIAHTVEKARDLCRYMPRYILLNSAPTNAVVRNTVTHAQVRFT